MVASRSHVVEKSLSRMAELWIVRCSALMLGRILSRAAKMWFSISVGCAVGYATRTNFFIFPSCHI